MIQRSLVAVLSALLLAAVGCGPPPAGGTDGGSDGGTPPGDGGFVTAAHSPFPQVPTAGGPVLAAPQLLTITFPNYQYEQDVVAFGNDVMTSSWLTAVGADYGVGTGTYLGNVVLPDTPPATASNAQTALLITERIQDGTLPPPGDPPILYMIFYPQSTRVDYGYRGGSSCSEFGGFHDETSIGGTSFPYALLPTCAGGFGASALDGVEIAASHELIEAATDPWPFSNPGYALRDDTNPWTLIGGEVGDLCTDMFVRQNGFALQRSWSNSAAAAGHFPCVPASDIPDFGLSTTPTTVVPVVSNANVTSGLTYTIEGWSAAPKDPWRVGAFTWGGTFDPKPVLDAKTLSNGQSTALHLTIAAGQQVGAYATVGVWAELPDNTVYIMPVAVRVKKR